jgi:hypothetical protein
MTHPHIVVDQIDYAYAPDDTPALAERDWAMIKARLVDEITGQAPRTAITLTADRAGLTPRVAADGCVGFAGRPWRVFPPLAAPNYVVDVTMAASGYLDTQAKVTISNLQRTLIALAPTGGTTLQLNSNAGLHLDQLLLIGPDAERATIASLGPGNQAQLTAGLRGTHGFGSIVVGDEFTPVDLGTIALHRAPMVIAGRTVKIDATTGATVPVSSAQVSITKTWPQPVGILPLAPNPAFIAIAPGFYRSRGMPITQRTAVNFAPVGSAKIVLADARAQDDVLTLSDQLGLSVGDLLRIDTDDITEYVTIKTIAGATTPDQPARITLNHRLAYAHREGALVQRVNEVVLSPPPPVIDQGLAKAALTRDVCVFLNDTAGLAVAQGVRFAGGPDPDEYHRLQAVSVLSNADGYYRLPPLQRVGQVEINAQLFALTATVQFCPDYAQRENRLDIVLQ